VGDRAEAMYEVEDWFTSELEVLESQHHGSVPPRVQCVSTIGIGLRHPDPDDPTHTVPWFVRLNSDATVEECSMELALQHIVRASGPVLSGLFDAPVDKSWTTAALDLLRNHRLDAELLPTPPSSPTPSDSDTNHGWVVPYAAFESHVSSKGVADVATFCEFASKLGAVLVWPRIPRGSHEGRDTVVVLDPTHMARLVHRSECVCVCVFSWYLLTLCFSVVRHEYVGLVRPNDWPASGARRGTRLHERRGMGSLLKDLKARYPTVIEDETRYVKHAEVTPRFLYDVLWSPERPNVHACPCLAPVKSPGGCTRCGKPVVEPLVRLCVYSGT
jgi:hypothetical protein